MTTSADSLAQALQIYQAGDLSRAESIYRELLAREPNLVDAWYPLGVILYQTGRTHEAILALQQTVQLAPHHVLAHLNLGLIYTSQGKAIEAIHRLRRAVELAPESAEAWFNLGNAYQLQQNLDQAIDCYQQSLKLQPHSARTLANLGWSVQSRGDFTQAIDYYRQAIACEPNLAEPYYNLATALAGIDQFDEAIINYQRATELKPDFLQAFNNLADARQRQGLIPEALAAYAQAMQINPAFAVSCSNWLFALNYDGNRSAEDLLQEHRRFGELFEPHDAPPPVYQNSRDPDRRLKVGYVSPDFYNHPAAYFIQPFITHHDPAAVESFLYAEVQRPDEVSALLQAAAGHWRDTRPMTDQQMADQIRADGIDILVDLAGHSAYNRLLVFAQRPAPVQVTYLGYPNTTGMESIAYRLADRVTDPPGKPSHCSEQLAYLPEFYTCFTPLLEAPAINPLPARDNGYITFGSLHKLPKLNARVFDLWQEVLSAIPTSRLLVFHHTLKGQSRERMIEELTCRGIDIGRVNVQYKRPADSYLDIYQQIDISLDAFPWSGHATTCESLWMGVPMLTLCGDRHASRLSASVLTAAGSTDWIATTPREFLQKAVEAAGDLEQLANLRGRLREQVSRSPLCDGVAFTRQLESTYRELWRQSCNRP